MELQGAERVLREHLEYVQKIISFSGSRKTEKERNHNNHGFGATRLDLGCWIFSREDRSFIVIGSREGASD
jgi:hypothetical protein